MQLNQPVGESEETQALLIDLAGDTFLMAIRQYLETGMAPGDTLNERRRIRLAARRFTIRNNVLLYWDYDGNLKICVPEAEVPRIIEEHH